MKTENIDNIHKHKTWTVHTKIDEYLVLANYGFLMSVYLEINLNLTFRSVDREFDSRLRQTN